MKLALVTGATSGIGERFALFLEKKGIRTMVTGRNADKLSQFQGEKIVCDLSLDRSKLISLIRNQSPDLIINNAGFGLYGEAVNLPIGEQLAMVEVNTKALLEICLEGAKALKETGKKGTILNISSAAGFQPFPTSAVYAATKSFVTNLSQSLDEELKSYGIRVLVSCPGMVATDFSKRASKGKRRYRSDRYHPGSMSVDFAVDQMWKQIEKQTTVQLFDWKTYLMVRLGQFLIPNAWIGPLLKSTLQRMNSYEKE